MPEKVAKADRVWPKELKGDRKTIINELSLTIMSNIDLSKMATKAVRKTRATQTKRYRGLVSDDTADTRRKDNESMSLAFAKARLEQRSASATQAIIEPDPVFSVTSSINTRDHFETIEKILQFQIDCTCFDSIMNRACKMSIKKNTAVWMVTFDEHPFGHQNVTVVGEFLGPLPHILDPDDFIGLPNLDRPLEELMTHGHRYHELYYVVKNKQHTGEFLKEGDGKNIVSGRDEEDGGKEDGDTSDTRTENENASTVEIWDVLHRHVLNKETGETVWLRVMMTHTGVILRVEKWENPVTRYALMQDRDEAEGLFAETGMGSETLNLQGVVDKLFGQLLTNIRKELRKQKLYDGGIIPSDMSGREDDEWLNVPNLSEVKELTTQNMIADIFAIIQGLQPFGDLSSNTPQTRTGGPSTEQRQTATAERIKQAGFDSAVRDDVVKMGPALTQVARIMLHFTEKYWDTYYEFWRDELQALQIETRPDFKFRGKISLTGQNPSEQPETQMEIVMQLVMMAQLIADQPGSIAYRLTAMRKVIELSRLPGKDELLGVIDMISQTAAEDLQWIEFMKELERRMMMAQMGAQQQPTAQSNGQQDPNSQPALGAPAVPGAAGIAAQVPA